VATDLYSREAEEGVNGACMSDPSALPQLAGMLAPADFYLADNAVIWRAIATLGRRGITPDLSMVFAELERTKQSEAAGNFGNVGRIARENSTVSKVRDYANVVREYSALRKLARAGQELATRVADADGNAAEIIAAHQSTLIDIQARARTGKGLVSASELSKELLDDLDRRREAPMGLSVGLPDLDALTNGFEPGDLGILAARPGLGKTTVMGHVADYVSQNVPVAVFSAEMPAHQLMRRSVANAASVPQDRLRRADRLTEQDWAAITPALCTLGDRRLFVDDTSLPTLDHIRAESTLLKARAGLGLVMVDYLQLVQGHGSNRYEQLRTVAYGLKALAKDLAVPVIALAQLNRQVEDRMDKRPYLSDLRDSGAIEEAADIVGLLYSERYYDQTFTPDVLECSIAKNRNGEQGLCLWRFNGAHSRITVLDGGARAQYRHLITKQHRRGSSDDL
jgi:replicative DNA helicase